VKGRCTYAKRKEIAEPAIGQIKEARGFRRFLLRGLENVGSSRFRVGDLSGFQGWFRAAAALM